MRKRVNSAVQADSNAESKRQKRDVSSSAESLSYEPCSAMMTSTSNKLSSTLTPTGSVTGTTDAAPADGTEAEAAHNVQSTESTGDPVVSGPPPAAALSGTYCYSLCLINMLIILYLCDI